MHLTKCRWIKGGELQGALKEVALPAAKAMGITQVTVWSMLYPQPYPTEPERLVHSAEYKILYGCTQLLIRA
jgi:hypothetical protein